MTLLTRSLFTCTLVAACKPSVEAPSPARPTTTPSPSLADACRVTRQRSATPSMVFVGDFIAARDETESGYASTLRDYTFRPLAAWRGVAAADQVTVVMFVPDKDDATALPPPNLTKGARMLVTVDNGGISGLMPVMREVVPASASRDQIAKLGVPCWKALGFDL